MKLFHWLHTGKSPPFQKRLREACAANGWKPVFEMKDAVKVMVPAGKHAVMVSVYRENGCVTVTGHSRAEFLPGRYPPKLRAALVERNRCLPAARWFVFGGPPGNDRAMVTLDCSLETFNAAELRQAAEELVAEVELLDAGLARCGII